MIFLIWKLFIDFIGSVGFSNIEILTFPDILIYVFNNILLIIFLRECFNLFKYIIAIFSPPKNSKGA